jgi:hypothetical protein
VKTFLVVALTLVWFVAVRADDTGMAKVYLRDLEQQVAVAKEKTDAPYAWLQCEQTLQNLEETVAKLPTADRAPFQTRIDQYKPLVSAGAARNRAANLARKIKDELQSAREDIAAGQNKLVNLQEAYFDRIDKLFAEKDLNALPPAELKKLKYDYATVKKGAK